MTSYGQFRRHIRKDIYLEPYKLFCIISACYFDCFCSAPYETVQVNFAAYRFGNFCFTFCAISKPLKRQTVSARHFVHDLFVTQRFVPGVFQEDWVRYFGLVLVLRLSVSVRD